MVSRALEEAHSESDPPPVDHVSSIGLVDLPNEKVPLEQSANLVLMREAAAAIRRDQITPEEYLAKVKQVALVADNGIKLFSAEIVKKETAKLPEEEQELIAQFEAQVYVLKEGTDLMKLYIESGNIDDLDNGLALVEKSMAMVDSVQDRALEMSALQKKNKAAAAAAAAEAKESEHED